MTQSSPAAGWLKSARPKRHRDHILVQARMPLPEPRLSAAGRIDEAEGRVVPAALSNPLRCFPYRVLPGALPQPANEDARKAERRAIVAAITETDDELLPRVRNGGGDHKALRQFTGVLTFWRRMANPPAEPAMWAANDNEPDSKPSYVTGGNPVPERPEKALPVPVRVSIRTVRNRRPGSRPMPARAVYEWHPDDVEFVEVEQLGAAWSEDNAYFHRRIKKLRRLKRLGGIEFSTVDNATATDKLTAVTVDKDGAPRMFTVPLGSIIARTFNGRRGEVQQDKARNRPSEAIAAIEAARAKREFYRDVLSSTAGKPLEATEPRKLGAPRKVLPDALVTSPTPAVTKLPPGLPIGPKDLSQLFLGIGAVPSNPKPGVNRPVDLGYAIWDAKADESAAERFRAANDNHALVLDAALVASNMTDLALVVGAKSPHTATAKLKAAAVALQSFLKENAG